MSPVKVNMTECSLAVDCELTRLQTNFSKMNDAAANYEVALLKRWNNITSAFASDLKNVRSIDDIISATKFMMSHRESETSHPKSDLLIWAMRVVANILREKLLSGSKNAEESAEQLRQFLSEASFHLESYTTGLLLESGKHCTDAHLIPDTYGKLDIHFLLDFDIAFLGVGQNEYNKHRQNIRKEYSHLNDEEYRQQRLKVLKLFMRIPNIYATRELRERFEVQARQNIANEISELSK
uniref:Uncharacterized protein n=1 Tax=Setaria digitata TaxID=48799 RepID=A0A915Q0R2_9BILA